MSSSPITARPPSPNSHANGHIVVTDAREDAEKCPAAPPYPPAHIWWRRRECPAWCDSRHFAYEVGEDRDCNPGTYSIDLSVMDSHLACHTSEGKMKPAEDWQTWPATLRVWMTWGQREAEPRIGIGLNDNGPDFGLTLHEAGRLHGQVASLLALAAAALAETTDGPPEMAAGCPWWQTRPCPSWCTGNHRDLDAPGDRRHGNAFDDHIPLTTEPADMAEGPERIWDPAAVFVSLDQPVLAAEPTLVVTHNGTTDIHLTLAEAGEFAGVLADCIAKGHAAITAPSTLTS
jgi:hypothetical protein